MNAKFFVTVIAMFLGLASICATGRDGVVLQTINLPEKRKLEVVLVERLNEKGAKPGVSEADFGWLEISILSRNDNPTLIYKEIAMPFGKGIPSVFPDGEKMLKQASVLDFALDGNIIYLLFWNSLSTKLVLINVNEMKLVREPLHIFRDSSSDGLYTCVGTIDVKTLPSEAAVVLKFSNGETKRIVPTE